jgi:hypothetical protein
MSRARPTPSRAVAWRAAVAWAGIGAVVGCAGGAAPPAAEVVVSAPAPERSAAGPVDEGFAAFPPGLAYPEDWFCELHPARFDGELRVAPTEAPYGSFTSSAWSVLYVPARLTDPAFLDVFSRGTHFHSVVDLRALTLHPARRIVLGGVVFVGGTADLHLEQIGPASGALTVSLAAPIPEIEGLPRLPLAVRCLEVGPSPGAFDVLSTELDLGEQALVGPRVPIRAERTGAPAGTLVVPPDATARVRILHRNGRDVRIAWVRDHWTLMGWVPTSALRPVPPETGNMTGSAMGDLRAALRDPIRACAADLPVGVRRSDGFVRVGTLAAGVRFGVRERIGSFVAVELDVAGAYPAEGTQFWLRGVDIADCPNPEPEAQPEALDEPMEPAPPP